jgi:hypothetical protein
LSQTARGVDARLNFHLTRLRLNGMEFAGFL